ncbi:MAG: histidinol-phosphatase [Firmicutes bacterium]|nr:histidinol-phosphatase [Bacillota bacterium]
MNLLNPKGNSNFHTHTLYCDGTNTVEELVEQAIGLGFAAIGFSGHEYSIHDEDFCMSKEETASYQREVLQARETYREQIEVFLGIERDYFGEIDAFPYDYVIGSLHYVEKDGVLMTVDYTEDIMVENVNQYFQGDYRAYVERYYEIIGDIVEKTGADIVGHFDLITKFNEGNFYFDEEAEWYKEASLKALRKVAASKPIFEINTGAMARGYRNRPYPAEFLLKEIERLECRVVLSSDCHQKENLNFYFCNFIENLKL